MLYGMVQAMKFCYDKIIILSGRLNLQTPINLKPETLKVRIIYACP